MTIQIDSREKARAIEKIINTFEAEGIQYIISKLYVADYMIYGHPELVIDRKQNLGEICGNICGPQHARFSTELKNAKAVGSKVIILIEDNSINDFEDVKKWSSKHTKVKGETLYKAMKTMEEETDKYNVKFMFCKKEETGQKIIEILGGNTNGT